jgi:hypothetical protein
MKKIMASFSDQLLYSLSAPEGIIAPYYHIASTFKFKALKRGNPCGFPLEIYQCDVKSSD